MESVQQMKLTSYKNWVASS